jgi:hypothetical protein
VSPAARAAAAGAAAAGVWALLEPLDRRLFRWDYSDVAVLGKLVTRSRRWWAIGLAWHLANGAVFGLVFDRVRQHVEVDDRTLALSLAMLEHVALYPTSALVDRYHPASGQPGVARLVSFRAFTQATARHAVFGHALGRLATGARG